MGHFMHNPLFKAFLISFAASYVYDKYGRTLLGKVGL